MAANRGRGRNASGSCCRSFGSMGLALALGLAGCKNQSFASPIERCSVILHVDAHSPQPRGMAQKQTENWAKSDEGLRQRAELFGVVGRLCKEHLPVPLAFGLGAAGFGWLVVWLALRLPAGSATPP